MNKIISLPHNEPQLQNTFNPQMRQNLRRIFFPYLDLCYVNPAFHKLKTFPLL